MGDKRGHGNSWEVPWGKHTPAIFRTNFTKGHPNYDKSEVLPVVLVRNPYSWMKSICRNSYTIRFQERHKKTCPRLKTSTTNNNNDNNSNSWNKVTVRYGAGTMHHESVAHLWNEWNGFYYHDPELPRLMVRFEDLIFRPKEVTEQICKCAGGILGHRQDDMDAPVDGFHYVSQSAKKGSGHGSVKERNGLVDSWIKYGSNDPKQDYSPDQLASANEVLDMDLMREFHYTS
jgi:hypothetical protein